MKTEAVVKAGSNALMKFGSATFGLAAGSFIGNKVAGMLPVSLPGIIQKIVPGLLLMGGAVVIAKKVNNDNAESLAMGLGLAGFANIAKNFLPDSVSTYIPLNGLGETYDTSALVLNAPSPDPNPQNYLMAATTGMAV